MKKILLINNTQMLLYRNGGYSKQMYYLCKMLKELDYTIYNLIFNSKIENNSDFTKLYSYDDLKQIYTEIIKKEEIEIEIFEDDFLKEINYLSYQNEAREILVEDINNIIEQNNIDKIFFLGDVFVFYKSIDKQFKVPSYCWYPCHYYPFSTFDYAGLKTFSNIICLSPAIKLILEKEFPDKKISYLPHVTEEIEIELSKDEIRDKWDFPKEKYIVLIVAQLKEEVNRKAIDNSIIAFKKFNDKYKNAILYIHSSELIKSDKDKLYPIEELIKCLSMSSDEYIINKKVYSEKELAELYKLSDVYLCCSKAEGFGVPIIEAQLYNTNVITSNYLSMAEHNFQKNIAEISSEIRHYGLSGSWTLPSTESIFNEIEKVYLNRDEIKIKRANWISRQLTIFNNVKENLYKIIK